MASSSATTDVSQKRPRRVTYDKPSADPRESPHWQSLQHLETDKLLSGLDELKEVFEADLSKCNGSPDHGSASRSSTNASPTTSTSASSSRDLILAFWSTICGYCEALTTHKDPLKRYRLFPIPIDALRRLTDEFIAFCRQLKIDLDAKMTTKPAIDTKAAAAANHREAVRLFSNAVWKKAQGKSKNVRDELHANSLYVCFRGNIDKRSLDCFGAAVVTIAALHNVLEGSSSYSFLTLSEDHAYESHFLEPRDDDMLVDSDSKTFGTSEIALSGNTKEIQQTRGLDVSEALMKSHKHKTLPYTVTPETSWLYMRKHPVICDTIPMTLAAIVGNINCSIVDKNTNNNSTRLTNFVASAPLLDLKRDLLWILNDNGHLAKFPFALMELGECEEHRTTARGLEWCDVSHMGIHDPVMGVEKLYLDAMAISRSVYGDAQAYPYFCAGHYHKDAVWEEHANSGVASGVNSGSTSSSSEDKQVCVFNPDQEYRLVEAVRLYSEASRVASQYRYDMQLMKHMTKAAMLTMNDILTQDQQQQPRLWCHKSNAIATGTWLVAFFDSLLYWEEACGGKQFCEILTPTHKYSIGKLLQQLNVSVRKQVVGRLYPSSSASPPATTVESKPSTRTNEIATQGMGLSMAVTEHQLQYFSGPRSKRLQKESPLVAALLKEKVAIREMDLTIPMVSEARRRAKRARR